MNRACPFCALSDDRIVVADEIAIAVRDAYPLTEGHTLVVPRRHVASLFDLSPGEQALIWELVGTIRARLQDSLRPDGFNIGLNDGPAAGQTVMHAHVHVIPRRSGDVPDPRGGVRWVVPGKADYWTSSE